MRQPDYSKSRKFQHYKFFEAYNDKNLTHECFQQHVKKSPDNCCQASIHQNLSMTKVWCDEDFTDEIITHENFPIYGHSLLARKKMDSFEK